MSNSISKLNELTTESVGRLLWRYSLPAVVGMLVNSLYNVIDRIFIGRGVGSEAIAGLTITFPVMNVASALGVLVGAGAAARVSIMLGSKDYRGAQLVLGNSLTLITINAAVYMTVFAIFMDQILRAFGASDQSLPYARDFLMYLLPGMFIMNLSFSFNNIMRASGYPVRAMVTMLIGTGFNVILAPIFIFALGWGIKGAAIATDIAMTISAVFVFAHFIKRDSILHFTRGVYKLRLPIVLSIISIGAAPSLVNAASSVINAIVNNQLVNHGGDSAVAAVGIFSTYTSLITMIVVGICQGMQPIVGYNYGAGQRHRLKRAFWIAASVSTLLTTIGGLIGQTCPDWVAMAFTVDKSLIAATVHGMSIALVMFWMVGFQIVATTFFQSIGQAGKSIFLSLSRQVLFMIPLLLILPRYFGLDGVWGSFPTSDVLATLVTAIMIIWQFRKISSSKTGSDGC